MTNAAKNIEKLENRLFPYQRAGVEFLASRRKALLADGTGDIVSSSVARGSKL